MIRKFFNLIEIALAIAIIAVGLSSILVLFPVGLNATNDATADNKIPDIADYMLGYLECQVAACWRDGEGNPVPENSFIKNQLTVSENPAGNAKEDETWEPIDDSNAERATLFYQDAEISGSRKARIFKYEQKYQVDGTNVVDFSAVMRVWQEPIPFQFSKIAEPEKALTHHTNPGKSGVALCVEISYPAEKPYAAREKQYFRREIYNQDAELLSL